MAKKRKGDGRMAVRFKDGKVMRLWSVDAREAVKAGDAVPVERAAEPEQKPEKTPEPKGEGDEKPAGGEGGGEQDPPADDKARALADFSAAVAEATKARLAELAAEAGLKVALEGKVGEQREAVLAAFKAKLETE